MSVGTALLIIGLIVLIFGVRIRVSWNLTGDPTTRPPTYEELSEEAFRLWDRSLRRPKERR